MPPSWCGESSTSIDDLGLCATKFEEHLQRLQSMLGRLDSYDIRLNGGKCHIAKVGFCRMPGLRKGPGSLPSASCVLDVGYGLELQHPRLREMGAGSRF